MQALQLSKAFTLIEPGPVVLMTTHDGTRSNVMTISWTMVTDFTPLPAKEVGAPQADGVEAAGGSLACSPT